LGVGFFLFLPIQQSSRIQRSQQISDHIPSTKRDRIQQLQQQIEAWQVLLEKLGGNE
jgi:hypothetical protein